MKTKLIIFGVGNLADVLCYYLQKYELAEVATFTVDNEYLKKESHNGLPLVAVENIETYFPPSDYLFLLPLTANNMNKIRAAKYDSIKAKGYSFANFIHPTAVVEADKIGENNIVFENAIIQPYTTVGNDNIIWGGSHIGHQGSIGSHNWFSAGTIIGGESTVANNCFFGMGSRIKQRTHLADETFVGMGVSINKDSQKGEVFVQDVCAAHKLKSDRLGNIVS